MEANIIKARLDDSDIPCFLTDENVATINPLYNQAIGGVKLNIFEKDLQRVNALLDEHYLLPVEEQATGQDEVHCTNCGSTNVGLGQATKKRFSWWVTLLSLLLSVYPFKANQCYHCYDCGHEFK